MGTHVPSPQVLAMAMLGGAGLLTASATGVSSSSTEDDDARNSETCAGALKDADAPIRNAPPRHLVYNATSLGASRVETMGLAANRPMSSLSSLSSPAVSKILSTSANILSTSDVSSERSASLTAAARLAHNPSARSLDGAQKTTNAANTLTETGQNATKVDSIDSNNSNAPNNNSVENDNTNSSNNEQSQSSIREENSYPAFTPYHHSLLKKYLTPAIWAKLSHLQTSHGTTIEDIIRAGLALPIGANPPRRVGVMVGDAECYTVFRELLDPIISEYHGIDNYEEWNDPELPMERYFSGKGGDAAVAKAADAGSSAAAGNSVGSATGPSTTNMPSGEEEYGVIKSSGADEDSDENDDSSFLLDEEDDMFVEYVALPSAPPSSTSSSPSPSSNSNNNSQSTPPSATTTTTARHFQTIAAKRKGHLRRHPTIINNPRLVTNREADPDGNYIVSTRVRVARSLDGVKFPATMSRSDRRKVQNLVDECTKHFTTSNLAHGTYVPVLSMANDQNLDLIERHVLFDNPNEWTIASNLGRDWPDGRALYANVTDLRNQTPDFMIWVNEEDHLRIMCLRKGGDIQGVFTTVMTGMRELERELTKRGWGFAYDPRLGYLTSCPTNVGTTMRASVHVRLTELGRLPGFFELVQRLKLEARGKYGETDRHYTGVFDISNAERLGKSEVHLINVMVEGVAKLIELERRLEAGEVVNIDDIA